MGVGTLIVLVALAVPGWILLGDLLGQRQPDLGVYYYAHELGDHLYEANVDKPFMPDGGLPFTYTPFAAAVLNVVTVAPFGMALWLWAALNCSCLVAVVVLIGRAWTWRARITTSAATLAATSTAAHLMMGQLNAILALLVVADLVLLGNPNKVRWMPRGVAVGIAAGIKLTPGIVIVYFLITRRWAAATRAGMTLLATASVGAIAFPHSTLSFVQLLPDLSQRVDVLNYQATSFNTGLVGALAQQGVHTPAFTAAVMAAAVLSGLMAARYLQTLGTAAVSLLLLLTSCVASPVTWIHHWLVLPVALAWAVHQPVGRGARLTLAVCLGRELDPVSRTRG